MTAWDASAKAGFDTGHFGRKKVAEKEQRDRRALGLFVLLAAALLAISLMKSSAFVEQWAGLTNLVQQWLN
jgi:hypothetical protein